MEDYRKIFRKARLDWARHRADASTLFVVSIQYIAISVFWIRSGGKAALFLTKPAARHLPVAVLRSCPISGISPKI
jgi:hypothetical protein